MRCKPEPRVLTSVMGRETFMKNCEAEASASIQAVGILSSQGRDGDLRFLVFKLVASAFGCLLNVSFENNIFSP